MNSELNKARLEGVQMGVEMTCQEIKELMQVHGDLDEGSRAITAMQRIEFYINSKLNRK